MEIQSYENMNIDKSAVALGKFQGLHNGHMLLIDKIVELAKLNELKSVVFTINIQYDQVINLDDERIKILDNKDVDVNVICDFTREFASMSPEEFVQNVIVDRLGAKYVVVGTDFKFGYKRLGNVQLLKELGKQYNFQVIAIDKLMVDDVEVSTTLIRQHIIDGKIDKVEPLLGRPYSICGKIVEGKKLGRTIGFPTANILVDKKKLLPPNGAYETRVYINGICYKAITNVGVNPTIAEDNDIIVETHIISYDGNLYGEYINVEFLNFIRPEQKFSSIDELKNQLNKDKILVMHQ